MRKNAPPNGINKKTFAISAAMHNCVHHIFNSSNRRSIYLPRSCIKNKAGHSAHTKTPSPIGLQAS
jgi:hypothetical protein